MQARNFSNKVSAFRIQRLEWIFWVVELVTAFLLVFYVDWNNTVLVGQIVSLMLSMLFVYYYIKQKDIDKALVVLVVVVTAYSSWFIWSAGGMFDEMMLMFPILMLFCGLMGNVTLFIGLWFYILVNIGLLACGNEFGWFTHKSQFNGFSPGILVATLISVIALITWLITKDLNELLSGLAEENELVKGSERKIQKMVNYDHLTGLPNRLFAKNYFDKKISTPQVNKKLCMMFLDLDNFKSINDTLGHDSGDAVLKEISARLQASVGNNGVVCRQGGDEFLVILDCIDSGGGVHKIVDEILHDVSQAILIEGLTFVNTVSIGISIAPDDGADFYVLSKKADIALYEAKALGKNAYCFYKPEMAHNFETATKTLSDLRTALTENQLELYYQPKVNFADSSISGVECLVRWNHPEKGLIYPDEFIRLAESSEAIFPLEKWAIEQACEQGRKWFDMGFTDLSIAANVSPIQFKRGDIVSIVGKAITDNKLPPNILQLEITETTLIDDNDGLTGLITGLQNLGVDMTIDDFGTGYSNLHYLKKMDFTSIKIDKSFVRDLLVDTQDKAIVQAVIDMGKTLALSVIAEGVEDKETAEELKKMGCQYGQGFYWAKALNAEDCTAYLATASRRHC